MTHGDICNVAHQPLMHRNTDAFGAAVSCNKLLIISVLKHLSMLKHRGGGSSPNSSRQFTPLTILVTFFDLEFVPHRCPTGTRGGREGGGAQFDVI